MIDNDSFASQNRSDETPDERLKLVLELLAEYTNKLRASQKEYERQKEIAAGVFGIAIMYLLSFGLYFYFKFRKAELETVVSGPFFMVTIMTSLIFSALMLYFFAGKIPGLGSKRRVLLLNDIFVHKVSLYKLIRRASQLHEYESLTFSQRLVLDLRLAEAESAINTASYHNHERNIEEVVHKKNIPEAFDNFIETPRDLFAKIDNRNNKTKAESK